MLATFELSSVLQTAANMLGMGQAKAAESLLRRAIQKWPDNSELIQFLGSANAQTGKLDEAEILYRQSLKLRPRSYVAINLGHILRRQGRTSEALEVYRMATGINPVDSDAHRALGALLHEMQDFGRAENAFRHALRYAAESVPAAVGLASVLTEQKKFSQAKSILQEARKYCRGPAQWANIEHQLGLLELVKGKASQSLSYFERAQAASPNDAAIFHARGRALQCLNRDEEALAAYRSAVKADPANLDAHHDLNQLLYRLNRDEEYLSSYDDAQGKIQSSPVFAVAKAAFLLKGDHKDEALAASEHALKLVPQHSQARQLRAASLLRMGRFSEAIDAFRSLVEQSPNQPMLLTSLATAYIVAGDAIQAEDAAARALKLQPYDQSALSLLCTAWRLQDDARELELNDYERLVATVDLESPKGFSDMKSFNGELERELDAQHPAAREYIDQSLRGGTQSLDFFSQDSALARSLRSRIEEAVWDYIASLPVNRSHPFLSRKSAKFSFNGSWSSRLRDRGYHTNHIHPQGWISSAYYVSVPDVSADRQSKQGWIKFGEPVASMGLSLAAKHFIQPKPGRLVLFPSYMWHGTIPFHSEQHRTTIAFDAVPAAPKAR